MILWFDLWVGGFGVQLLVGWLVCLRGLLFGGFAASALFCLGVVEFWCLLWVIVVLGALW